MSRSATSDASSDALLSYQRRPAPDDAAFLDRLENRRSVNPMHLIEPGPTPGQRHRILSLAARVPDHGAIVPWRFIVIEGDARSRIAQRLGETCVAAAAPNDVHAVAQAQNTARKFDILFGRPPLIVIVVMRPDPAASIPVWEQELSAGAACMNLITAVTAFGFEANWLTGWVAVHSGARAVLGLTDGEAIAGIVPIGTATERPPDRPRPDLARIVTDWTD
ncbi:nitroreductase (plasmid) [Methylobacterium sp. NMS12]|uniref:nitroreductase family protein n=1 Tax=Methylobacterium sp. NMS12 TaxID=3079766 RepID=UPI003F885A52